MPALASVFALLILNGSYRPDKVADGPITARYRFIKNASWDLIRNHFSILCLCFVT